MVVGEHKNYYDFVIGGNTNTVSILIDIFFKSELTRSNLVFGLSSGSEQFEAQGGTFVRRST